jgi:putative ABC transport system permease protein
MAANRGQASLAQFLERVLMNAIVSDQPVPRVIDWHGDSGHRSTATVWEAVKIAADSIWAHKLRSILTLLGIIIGVASVVTVGGAIEGLGSYVSERLVSTFGSNTFTLARIARMNISSEDWEKLIKRNKRIYAEDLQAVEERCDGCEAVVPRLRSTDDAKSGNRTFYDAAVSGINQDLPKIQELGIEDGRFLSEPDITHARPYIVIGTDLRDELFGQVSPIGKEVKLGGDSFIVIGVEKKNGTFFGQSLDNNAYIPYTIFLKKYGSRRSLNIQIKAPSDETMQKTQDEVRVIMRSRHHLRPSQEDDFDILASQAIRDSVSQFTGAIAVVVTPITLISLVVGGIVVMNIMLVTVTERTTEIGMRKALGARKRDIMLQFLVESAMLASAGGALGIMVAYGLGMIIRGTTPVPMHITVGYIALALLASGGIGLISGIYPAHRASKLDPIVALSRD